MTLTSDLAIYHSGKGFEKIYKNLTLPPKLLASPQIFVTVDTFWIKSDLFVKTVTLDEATKRKVSLLRK